MIEHGSWPLIGMMVRAPENGLRLVRENWPILLLCGSIVAGGARAQAQQERTIERLGHVEHSQHRIARRARVAVVVAAKAASAAGEVGETVNLLLDEVKGLRADVRENRKMQFRKE